MKALVHYEDRPKGRIAKVSKYRYVQSGKKVFFELPSLPTTKHRVSVFLYGDRLLVEEDYHIYWGKLFLHKYVPSRGHVYVVVTEEQEDDGQEG